MAKKPYHFNGSESRMVNALDKLKAFDEFESLILPQLRKDLKAGLTSEEIYKKYKHLAAARAVSITLGEKDSSKALNAVKEIFDRSEGKSTEKKEVTHRLDKLPDEQLDALLLTEMTELPPIEGKVKAKRGRPSKTDKIAKKARKKLDGQE